MVGGEEVVHRHLGSIVEVAGHHVLPTEVGLDVIVLHPEERELLYIQAALIIIVLAHRLPNVILVGSLMEHRAKCHDTAVVSCRVLVVVTAFLHIITKYIG